jgi:hypothetical protein
MQSSASTSSTRLGVEVCTQDGGYLNVDEDDDPEVEEGVDADPALEPAPDPGVPSKDADVEYAYEGPISMCKSRLGRGSGSGLSGNVNLSPALLTIQHALLNQCAPPTMSAWLIWYKERRVRACTASTAAPREVSGVDRAAVAAAV